MITAASIHGARPGVRGAGHRAAARFLGARASPPARFHKARRCREGRGHRTPPSRVRGGRDVRARRPRTQAPPSAGLRVAKNAGADANRAPARPGTAGILPARLRRHEHHRAVPAIGAGPPAPSPPRPHVSARRGTTGEGAVIAARPAAFAAVETCGRDARAPRKPAPSARWRRRNSPPHRIPAEPRKFPQRPVALASPPALRRAHTCGRGRPRTQAPPSAGLRRMPAPTPTARQRGLGPRPSRPHVSTATNAAGKSAPSAPAPPRRHAGSRRIPANSRNARRPRLPPAHRAARKRAAWKAAVPGPAFGGVAKNAGADANRAQAWP